MILVGTVFVKVPAGLIVSLLPAEQIENILGNQLKKGAVAALGELVLLNGLDASERMIYGKEAPDWPVSICINIGKIRDEIVKSLEAE